MDTFAHVALGMLACSRSGLPALRRGRPESILRDWTLWTAGAFAAMPDLSSFGALMAERLWRGTLTPGKPPLDIIPDYVFFNYNLTHSLIVAGVVGLLLWRLFPALLLPYSAWPLHVLCDIPLHGHDYFPTPVLWPLSRFAFNGYGFGDHLWIIPCYWGVIVLLLSWRWLGMRPREDAPAAEE